MRELLARHPDMATSPAESHVFDLFLAPCTSRFRALTTGDTRIFLAGLLSDHEFHAACRAFADVVLAAIKRRKPRARLVIEKTPNNVLHWEVIRAVFPHARFIHMIRDPRSVVASLQAASRSPFGRDWAPRGAAAGAILWGRHVVRGLQLQEAVPRLCREVRYEALLADTAGQLGCVLRWLGLGRTRAWCDKAARTCGIENLRGRKPAERGFEFFRRGEAESWREELSRREVRTIEARVGPLMRPLGYALDGRRRRRATAPRSPSRIVA
jgi:sulfotransferase family protein